MRRIVGGSTLLMCLVAAVLPCGADDPVKAKDPVEVEREANDATYAREAESLRKKHAGKWMAIAGGTVQGPFDSFDRADKATPKALHRYLYQPGVDDKDAVLTLSPAEAGQTGSWLQVGTGFLKTAKVTAKVTDADYTWEKASKKKVWPRAAVGPAASVALAPIGGDTRRDVELRAGGPLAGDLTITPELVAALGLDRASVPGKTIGPSGAAFTKVRCRVLLADLKLDVKAIAFVVPEALLKPPEAAPAGVDKKKILGLPRPGALQGAPFELALSLLLPREGGPGGGPVKGRFDPGVPASVRGKVIMMSPPPNATLGDILDIVCGQTGTTYEVEDDGTILIKMK